MSTTRAWVSTKWARRAWAAIGPRVVAFEIDGYDLEAKTGWSVLVKGIARYVLEDEEEAMLAQLDLRPWAPLTQVRRWVRISPEEITGRKIV